MSFINFFLTVFSILMIFGISSCSIHSEINQFWSFDDILFNTMRQRWKDADMKNYVFEYAISDICPNSIEGKVKVIDGAGTVELTLNGLKPGDEGYDSELKHYSKRKIEFKTIDEIYDFIKITVETRRISYEKKRLLTYKLDIKYDEQNFIPLLVYENLSAFEQIDESPNGSWDGSLYIKITKFK